LKTNRRSSVSAS